MDEIEGTDTSVSKKTGESKFEKPPMLPAGKNQVWPIIGRLLVNRLKSEAKPYHTTHDHGLEIGGQYINVPCYKALGQKCPFCEAYWAAFEDVKKLKSQGAENDKAPEELQLQLKRAQVVVKMLKQRQRFAVLWALPKDPTVYMFFMGTMLLKAIFGDSDKKKAGVVQELKDSYKVPIYNAGEPTGWISCNRSGQGLETEYTAKVAVREVIEGRKKTEELMEEPLHQTVIEKAEKNDLPRILEYFTSRFWSVEEMENFIDSNYTALPKRYDFLFKDKPQVGGGGNDTGHPQVDQASFEEPVMPAF
jgi:hypothetical protein